MAARNVWIYEGRDTFKMFVSEDEAQSWPKENDPEGIVIEQQISERRPAGRPIITRYRKRTKRARAMKIIEVEPYDPDKRTWSEPEPATSFRTIDGMPMYWCDDRGVVHVCEGADIHPDARVYWTLCGNDVTSDAYQTEDEEITCPLCRELAQAANDS